jgi:hypothetical protein
MSNFNQALQWLKSQRDHAGKVCKNPHNYSEETLKINKRNYPAIKEAYDILNLVQNYGGWAKLLEMVTIGSKATQPSLFDQPTNLSPDHIEALRSRLLALEDNFEGLPLVKRSSQYAFTLRGRIDELKETIQLLESQSIELCNFSEKTGSFGLLRNLPR